MADVVNPQVVDSVTIGNVKAIAEANAVAMNLATQNLVAHQNRLQIIAEAATGQIVKRLTETDIAEAGGLSTLLQQASKTAGNTPPVTP